MHILSHRGIKYRPNSLKALNKALISGFSLEIDLRLSKDGKIIIIHDQNLKNNFGLDINVNELYYKDLVHRDNKFVNFIPDFKNFIKSSIKALGQGQVIALHIKDFDNLNLIYRTCEIIRKYKLEQRVFIFDILISDIKKIKKYYPQCKIGLSVGEKNYGPTIYTMDELAPYIELVDIIWADEWKSRLYKKDFFHYYKKIKKKVYVISPELHRLEKHPFAYNSETLWKNILSFIFDGICTDFPEKARKFFNQH